MRGVGLSPIQSYILFTFVCFWLFIRKHIIHLIIFFTIWRPLYLSVMVCTWGHDFWHHRDRLECRHSSGAHSEWGCSTQRLRSMCIGFLPTWRIISSEHGWVMCWWHRQLCMTYVMSVLKGYNQEECMRGKGCPGQSSKFTRFQVLENARYLGAFLHQVC